MFRPTVLCGHEVQASAWIVVLTLLLGVLMAVTIDAVHGQPGAGVGAVAFVAPATVIPLGMTDIRLLSSYYGVCALLYVVWCVVYMNTMSAESVLVVSSAANLIDVVAALATDSIPYFVAAYMFVIAHDYTYVGVRDQAGKWIREALNVESDLNLGNTALRSQMPRFAMKLLGAGSAGVELEETTAILVLRVFARLPGTSGGRPSTRQSTFNRSGVF